MSLKLEHLVKCAAAKSESGSAEALTKMVIALQQEREDLMKVAAQLASCFCP